jgi:CSLREA domain-containing protein
MLGLALGAGPAHAATFTVDSTADAPDANPADGQCAAALPPKCTLRAAIMEANALSGADSVTLPIGTYLLKIAGQGEDDAATGDLDIKGRVLTITGAGAKATVVDANGIDRAFDIFEETRVSMSEVTVKGGNPDKAGGGGIRNSGILTLSNSAILGNADAGVMNNHSGTLRISSSTVGKNDVGIANFGSFRIVTSTISGNGGGIWNHRPGHLAAIGITISGNSANGLDTDGPNASAKLENCTISGNGKRGVHIQGPQSVELINVTVSANAGGGTNIVLSSVGTLTLKNTIIANNPGGNCTGGITASSYSLDSGATCGLSGTGDQSNADPKLGPLANNGGSTQTKFAPRLPEPRYAITLVAFDLRAAEALRQLAAYKLRIGPKITVEVLFSGEIGAPRCHARAEDARAGWIGTGLKPVMTRRGAVDRREGGERTDAAVIAAVEHRMPLAVLPRNLDDADAMRGHLDLNQFRRHVGEAGQVLTRKTREHHLLIGILVIDAKERAVSARIEQEEGDVVVV